MSGPDTVRVAAAQYPFDALTDIEAWTAKVTRWVEDAAGTGARLLVFPEYGAIERAAWHGADITGDLVRTLAAVADSQAAAGAVWSGLAAAHDVHILASSGPERRGARFVNAARLYAPSGHVGVQDKLILTPFERAWGIAAGETINVFETQLGPPGVKSGVNTSIKIGVAICYDSEFPLLVRAMAEAGARIILIPSCTEQVSGYHRVRTAAAARALESQVATVMSPTIGDAAWSAAVDRNTGAAGIFVPADIGLSPNGVIAEGRVDVARWVVGDIDLTGLERVRAAGETRNASDWALQPGAQSLAQLVTVTRLI